ncbi:hypothetical protein UC8_41090 [Roseimaritima ulvae]|uniref:Uncharacterized protein n=1 Tax=Roseimaritima ulvae TaxID=980254 RepID=A0A5B9QW08_9BACT|nr:hypothetical protein UC8_41090 [Roseimaritima ulvae]
MVKNDLGNGKLSPLLNSVLRDVIRKIRESDARALADTLDISISNVYRLQRGGLPSLRLLIVLAEYFDTGIASCELQTIGALNADVSSARGAASAPTISTKTPWLTQ